MVLKKVAVQKICRVSRNEKNVREALDEIWKNRSKASEILTNVIKRKNKVFEFEREITK